MASLHCECQELKPKVETNSSFLALRPSSGVDTNLLLTEREGRTGEYWPEVVTVRTGLS